MYPAFRDAIQRAGLEPSLFEWSAIKDEVDLIYSGRPCSHLFLGYRRGGGVYQDLYRQLCQMADFQFTRGHRPRRKVAMFRIACSMVSACDRKDWVPISFDWLTKEDPLVVRQLNEKLELQQEDWLRLEGFRTRYIQARDDYAEVYLEATGKIARLDACADLPPVPIPFVEYELEVVINALIRWIVGGKPDLDDQALYPNLHVGFDRDEHNPGG